MLNIKASGKSMFPLISSGDNLKVDTSIPFEKIEVAQAIAFFENKKPVAHRIIKKKIINHEAAYLTKGDHGHKFDSKPVKKKNYIGLITQVSNSHHIIEGKKFNSFPYKNIFALYSKLMTIHACNKLLTKLTNNFTFYNNFIRLTSSKCTKPESNVTKKYILHLVKLHYKNKLKNNCAWNFGKKTVNKKDFFKELNHNKLNFCVEHLENCTNCKNYFDDFSFKINSILKNELLKSYFVNSEKKLLDNLSLQLNTDIVFFKFTKKDYLKEKVEKHLRVAINNSGTDIDVLVDKNKYKKFLATLLLLGYKVGYIFAPLEVLLINERKTDIDLHLEVLESRTNIFNKSKTNQLTKELLQNQENGYLPTEYLFFSKIVRYWTNDFHKGIKKLYELSILSQTLSVENWQTIEKIAQKYGFKHEVLLTMMVCEKIFKFATLPPNLFNLSKIDLVKIKTASKHFDFNWLTNFTDVKYWWDENNYTTRKLLLEVHLLRTLLHESFAQLMTKPRVIYLFLANSFK